MASQRRDSAAIAQPWLAPVAVFLGTLLVQLPYFDLWFNFMDEGHMVQFADMARRGGEFYRDATFYPLPGAFWFLTLVFEVFGPSILVSRWVVAIEFALFVSLVFAFLRRSTGTRHALIGVAMMLLYRVWCFPHWHIYSYSTTSLLVLFASMLVLLRYFENGDRRLLGAAGLLYGLGVLCKQDYGAAALVAIVACLSIATLTRPAANRPRLWSVFAIFFLPAALVGGLTGLYYLHVGILDELLRFTVFNHFTGMSTYEYMAFPEFGPLVGQDTALRTKTSIMGYMPGVVFTADWGVIRSHPLFTDTSLYEVLIKAFIFGPQLFLALAAVRLVRRRGRLEVGAGHEERTRYLYELLVFVFGAGLVTLVWLNKPQDYLHLAVLYWPMLCLTVIYAKDWLGGRPVARRVTALVLVVPVGLLVAYTGRLVWKFGAMQTAPLELERAGIYAQPAEVAMLDDVVAYMRENAAPDERVGTMPYFPIVNFLAERDGPHRSAYIVWPFPEIPNRDEAVIAGMEETNTNVVIYNFTQFYSFNPVWEHAPILFEYLVDNFEIDRVFSYDAWGYKLAGLKRMPPDHEFRGTRVVPVGAAGLRIEVVGDAPPRRVPPESRAAYVSEMLWPFRRVVALRASTFGDRTRMSAPLSVPAEGGRLRTAVAVHPQWWFKLPPTWVEFSLFVREGDARTEVFRQRLNPTSDIEDRRWFEVDVDLAEYAGRSVTLEFVNEAERPRGETVWMGGWAVPRLIEPDMAPESASWRRERAVADSRGFVRGE